LGLDLAIHNNVHSDPVIVADSEFVCFKSEFDVNHDGNLWAGRGGTDIPTFDIWNEDLELIGTATIPEINGDGSSYQMVFGEEYIVAWNENPDDFQKVYFFKIN